MCCLDLMEGSLPRKVSLLFDYMGFVLFTAASVLCIKYFHSHMDLATCTDKMMLGKGIFATINGGLYLYAAYNN